MAEGEQNICTILHNTLTVKHVVSDFAMNPWTPKPNSFIAPPTCRRTGQHLKCAQNIWTILLNTLTVNHVWMCKLNPQTRQFHCPVHVRTDWAMSASWIWRAPQTYLFDCKNKQSHSIDSNVNLVVFQIAWRKMDIFIHHGACPGQEQAPSINDRLCITVCTASAFNMSKCKHRQSTTDCA